MHVSRDFEHVCSYTNSKIVDVGSSITSKSVILSVWCVFSTFFIRMVSSCLEPNQRSSVMSHIRNTLIQVSTPLTTPSSSLIFKVLCNRGGSEGFKTNRNCSTFVKDYILTDIVFVLVKCMSRETSKMFVHIQTPKSWMLVHQSLLSRHFDCLYVLFQLFLSGCFRLVWNRINDLR